MKLWVNRFTGLNCKPALLADHFGRFCFELFRFHLLFDERHHLFRSFRSCNWLRASSAEQCEFGACPIDDAQNVTTSLHRNAIAVEHTLIAMPAQNRGRCETCCEAAEHDFRVSIHRRCQNKQGYAEFSDIAPFKLARVHVVSEPHKGGSTH